MEVDVIPSAALPADGPAAVVRSRPNLVIWVMIALPAIAVIGSILLVFSSVRDAEAELPAHYAWEGAALDQDLARAQRTEQLGASMGLEFAPDGVRARRRADARRGDGGGAPRNCSVLDCRSRTPFPFGWCPM